MKFNLANLLKSENIEFRLDGEHKHARPGWMQVCCPFCNDSNFHMGHPDNTSFLNCYRCGTHSLWDYLEANNINPRLALRGFSLLFAPKQTNKKQVKIKLPEHIQELHTKHKLYLKNRGFNYFEIMHRWGVKATTVLPPTWRLIIPVYSSIGYVGWTSRSISKEAKTRYITAPNFDIKRFLYGIHLVKGDCITLVEGPTDAWAVGPGACALSGVNFTNNQILQAIKFRKAFILLDSDDPGKKAAKKLKNCLDLYMDCEVLCCSDFGANDPGALNKEQRKTLRKYINQKKILG